MRLKGRNPAWESREQRQRVKTKEEQAKPRVSGSQWSEVSRSSPAHELGMKMPINYDGPAPVRDICSQRTVGGPQCCRLKQEGMEMLEFPHLASHLCPENWQMGLVARHGCRQSPQEVGPPWLAACPLPWGHAHSSAVTVC